MLRQQAVDDREEALRVSANALPPEQRAAFYREVRHELRDPDTYAVLNWFLLAGLHHFYLRRWFRGLLNLGLFLAGIGLVVAGYPLWGIGLVLGVLVLELWALFRAQIIVQEWNNRAYERMLQRYRQT